MFYPIIISTFGYLTLAGCTFALKIIKNAIIPIRPMNIVAISTSFANDVRLPVIPIERPVVPNAEQTSKKISINGNWSLIQIKRVESETINVATM